MSRRRSRAVVAVLVALAAAGLGFCAWADHLERAAGRPDLGALTSSEVVYLVGLVANLAVGAVVALARRENPVGWLFLTLGLTMTCAAVVDEYVAYGVLTRPDAWPGGAHLATLGNVLWVPWFVLVALILLLTPTGTSLSPRWHAVARAQVVAGGGAVLLAVPSAKPFDPPYRRLRNPMQVDAVQPWADGVQTALIYGLGLGLVASGGCLLLRFRRSRGEERRRLLWLAFIVVPLPVFVVLAFVSSRNGADWVTTVATGGFVTLVPIAAGLSVLRFRLYDVERIVATSLTWVLLSLVLVATYGFVVWLGAQAVPSGPVTPALSATVGAVAAAGLAFPLRHALQDLVDRRLQRRAYDVRRTIRDALAAEDAGIDVEAVLRAALRDPSLTVAYPGPGEAWVRADGSPAGTGGPVGVDRHGRVVARIGFDPERTDAPTVRLAGGLAAAELDNTRLRAELARQVGEIAASRARLATAERRERRRIERDLHDGAQQSLLALAFDLKTAGLNGDPERMRQALADGVDSARAAVRELRDLANGLHPTALVDGGLAAALDDLARHSPVPVRVSVVADRLDPGLEFTAWTVIGEAVVNAQKHAAARGIEVDVARCGGDLRLRVRDDGHGGATLDGPGLRGLRDRVEAARGRLDVDSGPAGTTVEAVIPCGS